MMDTCPYCDSQVQDDNPVFVAAALERELSGKWSYAEIDSSPYYKAWPVGHRMSVAEVGFVELIDKKIKPGLDEMEIGYYYEAQSYPQGTEFETYVIVKVGDHFFRTTGHGDSYGDIVWTNVVKPVKPKQELRTAYVFE